VLRSNGGGTLRLTSAVLRSDYQARGLKFWDYGNSFLLEAGRAGAEIFPVTGSISAAASVSAHQPVAAATAGQNG